MADAIVKVVDGRAVVRFSGPEAIATMLAEAQTAASTAANAAEEVSGAVEAAEQILEAIENSNSQLYPTVEAVQTSDIPSPVTAIRVQGYAVMGDGGAASWIEVANTGDLLDGQITTNGGMRRWELSPEAGRVHVAQFGAFPGLHLDPDTEALWNAFSTKPSVAHIRRIDFFVSELKKHGVWQKLDALYVFAAQSASDILINWKSPAFNPLTVFAGTPRLIPGVGLRGDAVTCHLRGTVNMNAFPQFAQDDAHVGVGTRGAPLTGQSSTITASGGAQFFILSGDTNTITSRLNNVETRDFGAIETARRPRHAERHGEHIIISRDNGDGYAMDRSGYPFGIGSTSTRPSTGVPTGPLNIYVYPDSTTTDVSAKVTQFAHVGAALDAVDRKILYQHLRDLMADIPSVIDGEPSTQDMVDGPDQTPAETRARLQSAMNFAGKKMVELHFDRGVYLTNGQLFIPSGCRMRGAGMGVTTVRCADDVPLTHNVMISGWYDNRRRGIAISDMTLDYNWRRRTNPSENLIDPNGARMYGNVDRNALAIINSEFIHLTNVETLNAAKHCTDLSAPTYGRGLSTPLIYSPEPTRFVWMKGCRQYQGGDDNLTTHQCSDIWIEDNVSWSPQGSYVGENTNCYEIDEGSRNVFMRNCLGYGGICGLQIKGHNDSPAPYNINVDGCRFVNNVNGIELRHTDWYGPASAAQTALDTIRRPDGSPYLSSGVSPGARNVMISNTQVIAPCLVPDLNYARDPSAVVGIAVWQRAYENVLYSNVTISEGALDLGEDYWVAQDIAPGNGVMRVYNGGRHTQIDNLTITGFLDLDLGFYVPAGLDGPLHIRGFNCINGPRQAFYSSSDGVTLESYSITRDREPSGEVGSVAITLTGGCLLGPGDITGYDTKLSGSPAIVPVQKIGSFTPGLIGSSTPGTVTGTLQGSYIKSGRLVQCTIRMTVTSFTGAGDVTVTGLPFPVAAGEVYNAAIDEAYRDGTSLPGGEYLTGYAVQNTSTIRLTTADATTSSDNVTASELTSDFNLYFKVSYVTPDPF